MKTISQIKQLTRLHLIVGVVLTAIVWPPSAAVASASVWPPSAPVAIVTVWPPSAAV